MAKLSITVLTVCRSGEQLPFHCKRWNEVKTHIKERTRYSTRDPIVYFVVVVSKHDGMATTITLQLTPSSALSWLSAKERDNDKWRVRER